MLNNEQLKKLSEALKESANNTESVLIIDGVNTFLRAYATGMSQTTQGTNTGAISGFFSSIGYALKKINPSLCIIIFDGEKGSTRRRKLFSEYKNNRRPVTRRKIFEEEEVDSRKETYWQSDRLLEYLKFLPLITISIDRVEADDVIAYIARNKFLDKKIVIMSSDKDFMQLVDPRINIYFPTKKEVLDEKRLTEEFNIKPSNFIFYRIVDGDSSDNIPGVKNVGIKRLLKHLDLKNMDINNIDNFLDTVKTVNKPLNDNALSKIIEEEEQVRLNYKLMNLRNNDMMSAHASTQVDFILKDYEIPNLNKIEFLKMANDDNLWNRKIDVIGWLGHCFDRLAMNKENKEIR